MRGICNSHGMPCRRNKEHRRRITRAAVEADQIGELSEALAEYKVEEADLLSRMAKIEQRLTARADMESVQAQLRRLASRAADVLADPTPQLKRAVVDLLEVHLVRETNNRFKGSGSIPIPGNGGEADRLIGFPPAMAPSPGPQEGTFDLSKSNVAST